MAFLWWRGIVELVNWIGDNDHHRYVLKLSSEVVTNNVCDRVLVGDRSVGRGTHQFIQHSEIETEMIAFILELKKSWFIQLSFAWSTLHGKIHYQLLFSSLSLTYQREKSTIQHSTVHHSILTIEDISYVWKFRDHQISNISVFC